MAHIGRAFPAKAINLRAPITPPEAQTVTPTQKAMALTVAAITVTVGAVTVSPTATAIPLTNPDPTVTNADVATPSAKAFTLTVATPTVAMGGVTVTPDAKAIPLTLPDPTLSVGGVTASPSAGTVAFSNPDPTVTTGGVSTTPSAKAIAFSVVSPVIVHDEATGRAFRFRRTGESGGNTLREVARRATFRESAFPFNPSAKAISFTVRQPSVVEYAKPPAKAVVFSIQAPVVTNAITVITPSTNSFSITARTPDLLVAQGIFRLRKASGGSTMRGDILQGGLPPNLLVTPNTILFTLSQPASATRISTRFRFRQTDYGSTIRGDDRLRFGSTASETVQPTSTLLQLSVLPASVTSTDAEQIVVPGSATFLLDIRVPNHHETNRPLAVPVSFTVPTPAVNEGASPNVIPFTFTVRPASISQTEVILADGFISDKVVTRVESYTEAVTAVHSSPILGDVDDTLLFQTVFPDPLTIRLLARGPIALGALVLPNAPAFALTIQPPVVKDIALPQARRIEFVVASPTVTAVLLAAPSAKAVVFTARTPVLKETVYPAAKSFALTALSPPLVQIVSPLAKTMPFFTRTPSVTVGAVTLTPSPAVVNVGAQTPFKIGNVQVVKPASKIIPITHPNPVVTVGGVTISPAAPTGTNGRNIDFTIPNPTVTTGTAVSGSLANPHEIETKAINTSWSLAGNANVFPASGTGYFHVTTRIDAKTGQSLRGAKTADLVEVPYFYSTALAAGASKVYRVRPYTVIDGLETGAKIRDGSGLKKVFFSNNAMDTIQDLQIKGGTAQTEIPPPGDQHDWDGTASVVPAIYRRVFLSDADCNAFDPNAEGPIFMEMVELARGGSSFGGSGNKGAIKNVRTTNKTFRQMYIHDGEGASFWLDCNAIDDTLEYSLLEDQLGSIAPVFMEVCRGPFECHHIEIRDLLRTAGQPRVRVKGSRGLDLHHVYFNIPLMVDPKCVDIAHDGPGEFGGNPKIRTGQYPGLPPGVCGENKFSTTCECWWREPIPQGETILIHDLPKPNTKNNLKGRIAIATGFRFKNLGQNPNPALIDDGSADVYIWNCPDFVVDRNTDFV